MEIGWGFQQTSLFFASKTTIELLSNISKNPNTLEYVCLAEFMESPVQRETLVTLQTKSMKQAAYSKSSVIKQLQDYQSPCDTYSHRLSLLNSVLIDWFNPIRKLMQKNIVILFGGILNVSSLLLKPVLGGHPVIFRSSQD